MAPIMEQITGWFVTPQGNLLYSLVLGLLALAALVAMGLGRGSVEVAERKRIQQSLLVLLIAQVLLIIASWLAWMGIINSHTYLPPLDRLIALFSLVLIIWMWALADPNRWMAGTVIAVEVIVVIAGIFGVVWWLGQSPQVVFNASVLSGYVYFINIVVLGLGFLLLLWRRPAAFGFGIAMLVIFLAGYLAQFLMPQEPGDYAWFVHIGEMLGYPFLLALPRRLAAHGKYLIHPAGEMSPVAIASQVDEKLIRDVIDLRDEKAPQQYYQKLTRLVGQLMNANVCLLMMPPKVGGQILVPEGYNLQDDWEIDSFVVDGNKMPLLLSAMQSGKALQLDGDAPDSEVRTLTDELSLGRSAHLLEVPFKPSGSSTGMGILVLSKPYYPAWSEKDASRLTELVNTLISSAFHPVPEASMVSEQAAIGKAYQQAQAEAEKLRQEYAQLKAEYDQLASKDVGVETLAGSTIVMSEQQQSLQETVDKLEARNRELENLVNRGRPSFEEVEQLREELRAALTDLARIPTTLSKSDQRMLEVQLSAVRGLETIAPLELVSSIAQEFRQPLSSILGYTDLLLGESVGLLGAMQHKFLERIKASTERVGTLMNELVQVLAIDGGKLDQTPTMVEIEPLIAEAVDSIKAQISEKKIKMNVDIPEKLPPIQASRDALQQILTNLLQNACLATPEDGEIGLTANIEQKEGEAKFLMISITDQGGGIAREELQRVFSRRYKVENPLIQGVGDAGVGLAIVKSLAELLKGRVWVDTQRGIGSTFSVILPVMEVSEAQTKPPTVGEE